MSEWMTLIHDNDYEIMIEEPFSIRKKSTGKIIAEHYDAEGYVCVHLNRRNFYKHRIIAEMFIPNPDGLPCVDHISRIRDDNRLQNLRWCSYSDNNRNRGSSRNVTYNYIDELPDEVIDVNHYSKWNFDNLYFNAESNTFYFFNGVRYRELIIYEDEKTGALYVRAYDTDNKRRSILYNKFKREYHLI